MAKEGAHVTAIDQGEKVIKIAQLHNLESKLDINYKQLNIEDFYITSSTVWWIGTGYRLTHLHYIFNKPLPFLKTPTLILKM